MYVINPGSKGPKVLVPKYEPKFDTVLVGPQLPHVTYSYTLFDECIGRSAIWNGQSRYKTELDTNMYLSSMLGVPLEADWKWMRFLLVNWTDPEDAERLIANSTLQLVVGSGLRLFGPMPLSAFDPIIPRIPDRDNPQPEDIQLIVWGLVKSQLDRGGVKLWPWLEAPLSPNDKPWHISSYETFKVDLVVNGEIRTPMLAKVMLGPTLYEGL